jgi:hypothetical protein
MVGGWGGRLFLKSLISSLFLLIFDLTWSRKRVIFELILLFVFEIVCGYIAQAGLEPVILLFLTPECWDHMSVPPNLAYYYYSYLNVILNSSQLPCFFYIIFAKCYFKNEFC